MNILYSCKSAKHFFIFLIRISFNHTLMRYFFILIYLVITSCSSKAQQFENAILNPETFQKLSGAPLSAKYSNIASIKVVYEIKSKKIYFLNSTLYQYHFEFCQFYLKDESDLFQFNLDNYNESPERKFLLGNLNYNQSLNRYYLDLSAFDQMPTHWMKTFYEAITTHFFAGKKVSFLLNTERLISMKDQLKSLFPLILPEEIYDNLTLQTVSKGKANGKLRFIQSLDSLDSPLLPSDIIVLSKTPMYLPLVGGIIVTEFQTPLSHLSILGQNRKIPICAYKKAFSDPELIALSNQNIQFTVVKDTFYCVKKQFIPIQKNKSSLVLAKNCKVDSLIDIQYITSKSADFVGNKAANFGVLNNLSKQAKFKVPEAGFAIPFYFYAQHVNSNFIQEKVDLALKNISNEALVKSNLTAIRAHILNTPVDPKLIQLIERKLQKSGYTSFRFRSSTNAEDAAGFSGAGLYVSKTVRLNDTLKSIEKAIHQVWASVWNYEAFMERFYFGIEQQSVAMGILVHRSFPNEAVNGVAITKNIYRENYVGFVVNAQLGDVSVVNPPTGVNCDQFICSPKDFNSSFLNTIEVITFSSLNQHKLILSQEEIENLANQLDKIKRYYYQKSKKPGVSYENFGLDIEFKLEEKTRDLYIKQVRYYN